MKIIEYMFWMNDMRENDFADAVLTLKEVGFMQEVCFAHICRENAGVRYQTSIASVKGMDCKKLLTF